MTGVLIRLAKWRSAVRGTTLLALMGLLAALLGDGHAHSSHAMHAHCPHHAATVVADADFGPAHAHHGGHGDHHHGPAAHASPQSDHHHADPGDADHHPAARAEGPSGASAAGPGTQPGMHDGSDDAACCVVLAFADVPRLAQPLLRPVTIVAAQPAVIAGLPGDFERPPRPVL